jgi:hypothetical protein
VLRELVTELAEATRSRRVRSQKRKGAVAETRYKKPRLRPSAVGKRGSEVDALADLGLELWKDVHGKRKKGYERG